MKLKELFKKMDETLVASFFHTTTTRSGYEETHFADVNNSFLFGGQHFYGHHSWNSYQIWCSIFLRSTRQKLRCLLACLEWIWWLFRFMADDLDLYKILVRIRMCMAKTGYVLRVFFPAYQNISWLKVSCMWISLDDGWWFLLYSDHWKGLAPSS